MKNIYTGGGIQGARRSSKRRVRWWRKRLNDRFSTFWQGGFHKPTGKKDGDEDTFRFVEASTFGVFSSRLDRDGLKWQTKHRIYRYRYYD